MEPANATWIDHLVLAAASLEAGSAHAEGLLGVSAAAGGAHPGVGTHNALLSLGAPTYLEIIAPDPAQPDVERRGFGLDDPPTTPHLIAFAVGCADIDATVAGLRAAGVPDVGDPFPMSRRRPDGTVLAWRLAFLAAGPAGARPFLISWDGGTTPATDSPLGGRFAGLRAGDPAAPSLTDVLAVLDVDVTVTAADAVWLEATIETPSGTVTLR